ncbi:Uncharacterised protein [Klebsiella pneumoniae subsp. ozaenae]|uniref:Uncharacterized protein n=1 Tax=Klebsiella pneumoniae subsp. ozaenae TaxID=574 RepID=A0A377YZR7_KLEPO|nr:Uncharacterised protein [Klebsiella pneumoniae subsp. ozaenae]
MHTPVLFEHPLNEKMRTWLRIEFLIQQMASVRRLPAMPMRSIFSVTPAICWMSWSAARCALTWLKSWNASSVSCSHGQKCRASIRSALTSCAPVEAVLQHPDGRAAHWSVSA